MPKRSIIILPAAILLFAGLHALHGFFSGQGRTASPAPETGQAHSAEAQSQRAVGRAWARAIERPGIENFHRVTEELYRGAQPSGEGFRELAGMGIRTVINLRATHSDRDEIGDTPLRYEHISVKPWHAEDEDIIRFLRIVRDRSRAPFFVHCQRGADRTGMMVAVYRIAVCGWTKEEAIDEMVNGGFDFAPAWRNIIEYVREADVEKLVKQAESTE